MFKLTLSADAVEIRQEAFQSEPIPDAPLSGSHVCQPCKNSQLLI